MNSQTAPDGFYIVAFEPGAEHPALPTWSNRTDNPAGLASDPEQRAHRRAVPGVPGAFQLLNVIAPDECINLIRLSESLGFLPDAAVSLPREIRHNDSMTWVTDEATDRLIWSRVAHLLNASEELFGGKPALGINARFRVYRYGEGDYFAPHTDGAWTGSRVVNDVLVADAYPDRFSQMTFLVLLNDDFAGGATRFLTSVERPGLPLRRGERAAAIDVHTPAGGVLCFPHGMHPLQCLHSSEPITRGTKYILRTDVLFER